MKTIIIPLFLIGTVLSLYSCRTTTASDKEPLDSLLFTEALAQSFSEKTTAADSSFIYHASMNSLAEISSSKLALSRTENQAIRDFAYLMIVDFNKAGGALELIASRKNVDVPTKLNSEYRKAVDALKGKNGAAFDREYIQLMIEWHQGALSLMDNTAKRATDDELKTFAAKNASILRTHLHSIEKVKSAE